MRGLKKLKRGLWQGLAVTVLLSLPSVAMAEPCQQRADACSVTTPCHADEMMIIAACLSQKGDTRALLRWATPFIEAGNADALYVLGKSLQSLKGIDQNEALSAYYLSLAARQNQPEAQFELARLYERGDGVPQNDKNAVLWYRVAARNGSGGAQNEIGFRYLNGKGLNKDVRQAFNWFKSAAELKHPVGLLNLGFMYEQGLGTKKDLNEALNCYVQAAQLGVSHAGERVVRVRSELLKTGSLTALDYPSAPESFPRGFVVPKNEILDYVVPPRLDCASDDYDCQCRLMGMHCNVPNHPSVVTSPATCACQGQAGCACDPQTAQSNVCVGEACCGESFCGCFGDDCYCKDESCSCRGDSCCLINDSACLCSKFSIGDCPKIPTNPCLEGLTTVANVTNDVIANEIGVMYKAGNCAVDVNRARARDYLTHAAELGNEAAMLTLANGYLNGSLGGKDEPKAIEWLNQSASHGSAEAMLKLAEIYDRPQASANDIKLASYWYDKGARAGNPIAQYKLALRYLNGTGVDKDRNSALYWVQRSANQAHQEAISLLKSEYGFDDVTIEEIDKTDGIAYYELGQKYSVDEESSNYNYNKAVAYFEKGVALGNVDCMEALADLYATKGKSDKKAFGYYEKAAQKGHVESMFQLAKAYENGRGVKNNAKKAFEWYQKAGDLGHAEAQLSLAKMFIEGKGTGKDAKQAKLWLIRAARQGNAQAMSLLQQMVTPDSSNAASGQAVVTPNSKNKGDIRLF